MKKRLKLNFFLALLLCFVFVMVFMPQPNYKPIPTDSIWCFDREWNDQKVLPNIAENYKLQPSSDNIFFHETSCSDNGVIGLTSRQACAVESAGEAIKLITKSNDSLIV